MRILRALCPGFLFLALLTPSGQAQTADPAITDPAIIRVLSPGVVYNAGLLDLAAGFTKQTGIKVYVLPDLMGKIVGDIKTRAPAPDVIFLPPNLMAPLAQEKQIVPGTRAPLGRVEIGLAVKAGAPHPDISTVAKLALVLKSAHQVMVSNPAGGMSMEAGIIASLLKRPDFAGVSATVSTDAEGGQALAKGQGDMALQLVCEIYPYPQIALAGALPPELNAHIDNEVAVSARTTDVKNAKAFIAYITRPEAAAVWKAKGLDRP